MRGQVLLVLSGLALTLLGLALAVDVLSARALLGETGLAGALPFVGLLRAALEHEGAQLVEVAGALIGLGLMGWATWRARRGVGSADRTVV